MTPKPLACRQNGSQGTELNAAALAMPMDGGGGDIAATIRAHPAPADGMLAIASRARGRSLHGYSPYANSETQTLGMTTRRRQ